jgi:hypothetical protein
VGNNGAVLHYTGSWADVPHPFANAYLYGVWGTSATNVWVAGGNGILARYDGASWSNADIGVTTIASLWGAAANDIFAGGIGGMLFHYDGAAWSEVRTSVDENIFAIGGVGKATYFGTRAPTQGGNPVILRLQRDVDWPAPSP